jgi:hypothetical protein
MIYKYSWERTTTLSPLDFISEQNNIWEEDNDTDNIETLLIPLDDFDELEIL